MTHKKNAITMEAAFAKAGKAPVARLKKPFAERAAEAEAWGAQMDNVELHPIIRAGRPSKRLPKMETELISFRAPIEDKVALEQLALSYRQSVSQYMRGLIRQAIAKLKEDKITKTARAK